MKLYDVTRELFSAPRYPDVPKPILYPEKRMREGSPCDVSNLLLGLHSATHCDALSHFIEGGADISEMLLRYYFGLCQVLQVSNCSLLGKEAFLGRLKPGIKRLLLKDSLESSMTISGSRFLASQGIFTLGTEATGIASPCNAFEVHRALMGVGIAIIEGLDLSQVPPGCYMMSALPIKISGAEAAPCRAVLWEIT